MSHIDADKRTTHYDDKNASWGVAAHTVGEELMTMMTSRRPGEDAWTLSQVS